MSTFPIPGGSTFLKAQNNLSDVANEATALANLGGLGLVAATSMAGFALQNATPTILSWTAPNDGQLHRVLIFATLDVTSAETGGSIFYQMTAPDSTVGFPPIIAPAQTVGLHVAIVGGNVKPGTQVLIQQTALTVGAAILWAEIWAL